jgi:hypothetical protein
MLRRERRFIVDTARLAARADRQGAAVARSDRLLLYYFLGGLFFFLLAREWGARREGALLGAVAFVFAPNLVAVGSHGHGSQLVNSAYIPLLLWLTARWLRRGGLDHLGWLALAGGFQMLRGHAQIAFYTWLAVGLYVLVDLIADLPSKPDPSGEPKPAIGVRLARAAGVAGAMGVAFAIAGFYNLPLRDYSHYSIRGGGADGGVGMDYATAWSLAGRELPTIVIPGAVGFGGPTYWGTMPFTDYPNAYVGMITVHRLAGLLAWNRVRIRARARRDGADDFFRQARLSTHFCTPAAVQQFKSRSHPGDVPARRRFEPGVGWSAIRLPLERLTAPEP